jgi:hypothetical protein
MHAVSLFSSGVGGAVAGVGAVASNVLVAISASLLCWQAVGIPRLCGYVIGPFRGWED